MRGLHGVRGVRGVRVGRAPEAVGIVDGELVVAILGLDDSGAEVRVTGGHGGGCAESSRLRTD